MSVGIFATGIIIGYFITKYLNVITAFYNFCLAQINLENVIFYGNSKINPKSIIFYEKYKMFMIYLDLNDKNKNLIIPTTFLLGLYNVKMIVDDDIYGLLIEHNNPLKLTYIGALPESAKTIGAKKINIQVTLIPDNGSTLDFIFEGETKINLQDEINYALNNPEIDDAIYD